MVVLASKAVSEFLVSSPQMLYWSHHAQTRIRNHSLLPHSFRGSATALRTCNCAFPTCDSSTGVARKDMVGANAGQQALRYWQLKISSCGAFAPVADELPAPKSHGVKLFRQSSAA